LPVNQCSILWEDRENAAFMSKKLNVCSKEKVQNEWNICQIDRLVRRDDDLLPKFETKNNAETTFPLLGPAL
jgi:hypothetical protein